MNYLEQIFFDGRATKEDAFELGELKISYKITNLTYDHQLEVDDVLANMPENSSNVQITHTYIGEVLARTLIACNDKEFDSPDECKEFLAGRPAILSEILGKRQGDFEKEIRTMLTGDAVDEAFSTTPSQPEE